MTETISNHLERLNPKDTLLGPDFQPSPYSVICGRGKVCFDALGNRRLKVTATMFMNQYSEGNKVVKSEILTSIIAITKGACPQERGAFIKYVGGRWWEVDDGTARDKVGCVLRDCLHDKYRSSSKSKIAKRRTSQTGNDTMGPHTLLRQPFCMPSDRRPGTAGKPYLTGLASAGFQPIDPWDCLKENELPLMLPLPDETEAAPLMTFPVNSTTSSDASSCIFLDEIISLVTDDDDDDDDNFSQISDV